MAIEIGDAPLPDEEIARLYDVVVTTHAQMEEQNPIQAAYRDAVEQYERAAFNVGLAAHRARRATRRARLLGWLPGF